MNERNFEAEGIMTKRQTCGAVGAALLILFLRAVPALAHADRVIPHVVNGASQDISYRTKFDITNISYSLNPPLSKVTLLFFRENGSPWSVPTRDYGTVSELPLNLSPTQTVRIETTGTGSLVGGYAILRNLQETEGPTNLPEENEVTLTVYYEVLHGGVITETVSVPTGQPTVSCTFPVEIDMSANLLTGFAIVNLQDSANTVDIDLYSSDGAKFMNRVQYVMTPSLPNPVKKTARFLHEAQFFNLPPGTRFKGSAFVSSTGPVAVLALLQTPTPTGEQYATLVPTYIDALRRNTLMYLPQGYSLDADIPVVDYFRSEANDYDPYYETPWDILLQTVGNGRSIVPQQGMVAVIGVTSATDFDAWGLEDLRSLSYTADSIDMSDNSPNLANGFTFAIKTGLGRYVKVRVREWVEYSNDPARDLLLEIYVYK
jgi:hypothetical protein